MSDAQALMTEAEKLAAVADAVGRAYAIELARVLRDLERQLPRLVVAASDGSRTAMVRAVRAAAMRRQLRDALTAAGYDDLASTATTVWLDRMVAQVASLRGAAKLAAFTSSDMTRILALKDLAKTDLLQQGAEIAHAVWRTFAQGLFSQRPVADLLEDLADAIDVETKAAATLYDTAVNVFGRQVEALKAAPGDVFAFMGPADVKTRPFCRGIVGKVFTRAEIDTMDNGQLPNVFLTGGGFNCRHQFIAVSKVSALRELVGTNQRMPEVAAQLQRTPAERRRAA
jgi:hypothetical protein